MAAPNSPRSSLELPQWMPFRSNTTTRDPSPDPSPNASKGSRKFWPKSDRLPGLCKDCSKIDFDQFASPPAQPKNGSAKTTTTLISLFDIIDNSRHKNQNSKSQRHQDESDQDECDQNQPDPNQRDTECQFCTLLFDAIALPQHDPFNHPAVKDHMPDEFKGKTFETWAKGIRWHDRILNIPHPFGQSRNKIKIKQDKSDPDKVVEIRRGDLEVAENASLVGSAVITGVVGGAASQDTNKDRSAVLLALGNTGSLLTSALILMDNKLPVVITIKMHNVTDVDAGLLKITVLGYGSKVQAPLSTISTFNLRVASGYMVQDDGLSLRYGGIMKRRVNVEKDCLTWVNHCLQRHGELCATPDWSAGLPLPSGHHFRLIDIQEEKVVKFEVKDRQELLPKYAALSYVWGDTGRKALNLHRHNVSQLEKKVDDLRSIHSHRQTGSQNQFRQRKNVARTITDAVEVAQRLDIRYLWADCLCVIQKDGEDDDRLAREEQLKQMDSIFGHAAVVIIAAAGENSEAGLAGITSSRKPGQIAKQVRTNPDVNVLLPIEYDKSYGKWDTRGWTLQEKLLSKRMLVFDSNHVSFHCRHGVLREDMPAVHACNGPPQIPCLSKPSNSGEPRVAKAWNGTPVLLRSPFFNEYAKLLEQYTSRDMTNSGDILNGILGLLRVLENMRSSDVSRRPHGGAGQSIQTADQLGDHTLYGLPEEFLDLALLWQPPAVKGTYLTKREHDDLPSWSWAGWEVGKDPSDGQNTEKNYKPHQGVRFEEPFWVSGNDDMSLRKFVAKDSDAEERFNPLLMWYKWRKGPEKPVPNTKPISLQSDSTKYQPTAMVQPTTTAQPTQPTGKLVPVNREGLGIVCGSHNEQVQLWDKALRFLELNTVPEPPMSDGIPLDDRHLVCETQVARFKLRKKDPRKEVLWKQVDGVVVVEKELEIVEAEVLDDSNNVVGYVIPTDQRKAISNIPYDLVLLSESQYWGNEKRIDITGFPLYNVMVIKWDNRREFATRVGLGKVFKSSWRAANPGKKRERVILK